MKLAGPLWTDVAVIVMKKVDQVEVAPGATADSTAARKALVLMRSVNTPTAVAAATQRVPRIHDGTIRSPATSAASTRGGPSRWTAASAASYWVR